MVHLVSKVSEHAVLFSELGSILLLKTHPFVEDGQPRWTLPGGKIEGEDTPGEGLLREIREETGLTNVEVIMPFYTCRWGYEDPMKYSVVYLARIPGQPEPVLNEENADFMWVDPTTLPSEDKFIDEHFYRAISHAVGLAPKF
jgi:ADP-ribose pyrophosphatase YjhB (NUDIX family)